MRLTHFWSIHLCLGLTIAALTVNAARLATTQRTPIDTPIVADQALSRPPTLVPYTVVLRERITSTQGKQRAAGTYTSAQRSDGSFVSHSEYVSALKQARQRDIHFASHLRVETDDLSEFKTTTIDPSFRRRDPSSNCMKSFSGQPAAPVQVIGAVEEVQGFRTLKIISRQVTAWFAPDLGCAVLKVFFDQGAGRSSEKTAEVILPGEPAAELFEIPSHFREVPPSVLYRMRIRETAERFDALYYARHPK